MKLHAIAIDCGFDSIYTFYGELLDDDVILPRYVVPCSNDPVGYLGVKPRPKSGYYRWMPIGDQNLLTLDVDGRISIHSDDGIYVPHIPLSFDEAKARKSIREDYANTLVAYHDNIKTMIDSDTRIVGMRMPRLPKEVRFTGDLVNTIFGVPSISLADLNGVIQ